MTSPKNPPKESLRGRISTRLSTDKNGRYIDEEARHSRNVTWMFYGLIVVAVVIIVGALLFGYWESNLKPLANVDGTQIGRGDLDDRKKLEEFRLKRADTQTSSALAAGTIDSDLANRRFTSAAAEHPSADADVMTGLVNLIFASQLAATEGVELGNDELEAAIAADGTFPETRQIDALIVLTAEQEAGQAATDIGIADARERALAAVDALKGGADAESLAETYGPANFQSGYVIEADLSDAAWATEIFAIEEGGVTAPIEAATGEQLIAVVKQIVPETADPGFVEAVNSAVGEGTHRRNVELEALAVKLEQQVTDDALAAEYDQVELAEIFIERNQANPDDTAGEAHASHILYQPETPLDADGNPTALADLPADDPAWAAAEAEAQAAADELAAIEDPEERATAFAERAIAESDGPSAPTGGDLGWFPDGAMVPAFNDAIWKGIDLQPGDILGPIRTEFGWHVIMFEGFRSSLDVRVADVQKALAEDGADFATVAAEYSDGSEAAAGGKIGWQILDQLDPDLVVDLTSMELGQTTDPVDEGDGYRIYQKLAEETRPLGPADAAQLAQTAYLDWYDEQYFAAEDAGRISIDDSVSG